MPNEDVPIREYIEALFDRDRAARDVADAEREKAAQALAHSLALRIEQGDRSLQAHIDQQVAQLEALVSSARREAATIQGASERAIAKQEAAYDERFRNLNEWRGQSADRERSQEEQMRELSSTFLPREVAEARLADVDKQLDAVKDIISARAAARAGEEKAKAGISSSVGMAIAVCGLLVSGLAVLVTVVLAANGVL